MYLHHLMPNTPSSWVEINSMFRSEVSDSSVLLQVTFALVLHVMVQRKYQLSGVCDQHLLGRIHRFELLDHSGCVVVCHAEGGLD